MKNLAIAVVLAALCVLKYAGASAQQLASMTLDDLIQTAVDNNGGISAYYDEVRSIEKKADQAGYWPDPELDYTYFVSPIETRIGPQRHAFSLSQRFPLWNKRGLEKAIQRQDASVKTQQAELATVDLRYQVQKEYYNLYEIRASAELVRVYQDILGDFELISATRYATGKGTQQSILKAQLERIMLDEMLVKLDEDEAVVLANLDALLNRSGEDPLIVTTDDPGIPETSFDHKALIAIALETRQDLKAVGEFINKQDLMIQFARKQYYPDIAVSVGYVEVGSGGTTLKDDGKDHVSVSLRVNLPIWRGKYAAGVDEAILARSSGLATRQDLKAGVEAAIKEVVFRIVASRKKLDLYKSSLIPQAETVFESAVANYQTGKIDFLSLLDAQRTLFELNLRFLAEKKTLHQEIARLEQVVGTRI